MRGRAPSSIITGGPGSSDIPSADSYTDYYATSITDAYDIVFMDQRGIGLSGPIQCTNAAATYYSSPARTQVPAERDGSGDGGPDIRDGLHRGGRHRRSGPAVLRDHARPSRTSRRSATTSAPTSSSCTGRATARSSSRPTPRPIPTRSRRSSSTGRWTSPSTAPTYYVGGRARAEDTLIATLDALHRRRDVHGRRRRRQRPGGLRRPRDELDARRRSPSTSRCRAARPGSARADRSPTRERGVLLAVLARTIASSFQRAVAAASHERLRPDRQARLRRHRASTRTRSSPIVDPTWSDAMYYAVECQDYAFYPDRRRRRRAARRVDRRRARRPASTTSGSATCFYGDLPCLYWPTARDHRPSGRRRSTDPPYPVFVLTSTTDPATPIANGMRIYSRLSDA